MEKQLYRKQVSLLLDVLPEIAKENCFALHGGTAINLFIRDMPRLSVDIDLTYIPIESREDTLINIVKALERIKSNMQRVFPNIKVLHQQENLKLQISSNIAQIKVEVNQAMRGLINASQKMQLSSAAQVEFDAFCAIQIVPFEQLYGGKICAALDRQHPRDLFDVKYLLKNEGFSSKIKNGFLLSLLSSNRPINEMLYPNFLDQQLAMINQFDGMSNEPFNYKDFEETREALVHVIHKNLTDNDKQFLLSFKNLKPDWSIYDFEKFPAVQWKLQNLQKLKDTNPLKYEVLFKNLKEKFDA